MSHIEYDTTCRVNEIPPDLAAERRFVVWRLVHRDSEPKPTKVPCSADGTPIDVTEPHNWRTLPDAVAVARRTGFGIGVALDNGLLGVDLDDVRDPATGRLTTAAQAIVAALASYTEVSPSGAGVHVLLRGTLPDGCRHRAPLPGGGRIEIYDRGRFFTCTGRRLPEAPADVATADPQRLVAFCRQWGLLPHTDGTQPPAPSARSTNPNLRAADAGAAQDMDPLLVDRAGRADPTFAALWRGELDDHPSASEADLALCIRLLALVGGDVARADRLFRQSPRYRAKWDERHRADGATYGQLTWEKARAAYVDRLQEPVLRLAPPSLNGVASADAITEPAPDPGGPDDWDEPVPLDAHDVPPFPVDALPGTLAQFVTTVATARQVPVDVPGTLVLAALAAGAQRLVDVEARPGWVEPLSLYTVAVLPSGERKTAVFADVTAPLTRWERRRTQQLEATIAAAQTRRAILEQQLRHAEARAAKAPRGEAPAAIAEAEALARELAGTTVPPRPRLVTDDTTPEALARLLAEHGGRLAAFADEGDLFDLMRGRYGTGPNLGVYLRAHAGSPLRVDRIGRPPVHVSRPALTIGVTVQPSVLHGLQHDPHLRGRGLLARFLYCWPRSLVGRRDPDPPPVPTAVRVRYSTLVETLLDRLAAMTDPSSLSDDADGADDDAAPVRLHLTDDAYRRLVAFQTALEPRLGPDGDLAPLGDWAGKLAGAAVRLAGLLHLADWADSDPGSGAGTPGTAPVPVRDLAAIDGATMDRALRLAQYFLAHARYAFRAMGSDPCLADARYLWGRIMADGGTCYTRRDLLRLARRFDAVAALDAPLRLLLQHGYLRLTSRPPASAAGAGGTVTYDDNRTDGAGRGRPPGPYYLVNPRARGGRIVSFLSRGSRTSEGTADDVATRTSADTGADDADAAFGGRILSFLSRPEGDSPQERDGDEGTTDTLAPRDPRDKKDKNPTSLLDADGGTEHFVI